MLPQKLLHDLQTVKGFDEKAFIAAHEAAAVTSVRVHPVKGSGSFDTNVRVPWCDAGRYLDARPVFTVDSAYHGGAYYVQEASSMFLHHVLKQVAGDRKGLRVLDLCAAPGGKSTLIASYLDKSSLLISNEVIRTRASILEENMTRWGYMNTWVTSNDPRDFGRLPGYFDIIVVDAPCSGSGLFRKDKRALDEWSEGNVVLCSQRQQRILADVWPSLKEDGVLIYATCSYSEQEDEQILDELATMYKVESIAMDVPEEWGVVSVTSSVHKMAGYRFFPDKVKGEGFFIAALRKKEEPNTLRPVRFKSADDKKLHQLAGYLLQAGEYTFIQRDKENHYAIHPEHEADMQILLKALYLRKTGLMLGMPTAKEWLPDHEVAMSVDRGADLLSVNVSKEQALHFLKKEEMNLEDIGKGWHLVCYNGIGLGWIKSLGNRINNYLPKHWRIRMEIGDADWA